MPEFSAALSAVDEIIVVMNQAKAVVVGNGSMAPSMLQSKVPQQK